jgi:predicted transcriptional regulator
MDEKNLGTVESRFADLIWLHEPIRSGELVKLCERELSWKKPTTYTVLRRLCQRGLFQNTDGLVTSLVSREEFYAMQSERFVEETFSGSLPSFLAAFTRRRNLSLAEIAEIRSLIDSFQEG